MTKVVSFLKDISIRKYPQLKLWINKKDTYLYQTGWLKSYKIKKPINLDGEPMPWLSLSLNLFLDERISKELDILEYGSGNSTLYFSKYCKSITSIENDKFWFEFVKNELPKNAAIYCVDEPEYANFPKTINKKYDIILVDGINRNKCFETAFHLLKEEGIIILDDSDRTEYGPSFENAKSNNFKHLNFHGMGLGSFRYKISTLFYKDQNCLSI